MGEWSPLETEVNGDLRLETEVDDDLGLETEVDGDLGHDERGDDAGDQIHAVVVQNLLPYTYKRNPIMRLRGVLTRDEYFFSAVFQPVTD